jgi:hypothetical protein
MNNSNLFDKTFERDLKRAKYSVIIESPYTPRQAYTIVGQDDSQVCSIIDISGSKTPDLMLWLKREFGKEISTRTYKTVERIFAKLN